MSERTKRPYSYIFDYDENTVKEVLKTPITTRCFHHIAELENKGIGLTVFNIARYLLPAYLDTSLLIDHAMMLCRKGLIYDDYDSLNKDTNTSYWLDDETADLYSVGGV